MLGLIGLGFVIFGLGQVVIGYKQKFVADLRTQSMDARQRTWVVRAGRIGYIARGIVFSIIGVFLIQAVLRSDPSEAQGLGGALHEIASQPFGQILLVLVSIGLAAYGAYQMVFAKYGRLVRR